MFRFRLSPVPILWTSAQGIFENLQLIEEIRLKIFNGMKILYRIIGRGLHRLPDVLSPFHGSLMPPKS